LQSFTSVLCLISSLWYFCSFLEFSVGVMIMFFSSEAVVGVDLWMLVADRESRIVSGFILGICWIFSSIILSKEAALSHTFTSVLCLISSLWYFCSLFVGCWGFSVCSVSYCCFFFLFLLQCNLIFFLSQMYFMV
jgi:hypothetical protein